YCGRVKQVSFPDPAQLAGADEAAQLSLVGQEGAKCAHGIVAITKVGANSGRAVKRIGAEVTHATAHVSRETSGLGEDNHVAVGLLTSLLRGQAGVEHRGVDKQ